MISNSLRKLKNQYDNVPKIV